MKKMILLICSATISIVLLLLFTGCEKDSDGNAANWCSSRQVQAGIRMSSLECRTACTEIGYTSFTLDGKHGFCCCGL